ncbi:hypothetical protein HYS28_02320 [Candidatus Uhrbacteria bacterium]|nr:hypothetical protein [Candidatus Uhrbacteria bacterium]
MEKHKQLQFTMNVLWGAFTFAILLYGFIGWYATDHRIGTGPLWEDIMAGQMWFFAALGALFSLGMARWNPPATGKTFDGRHEVSGPFVKFLFRAAGAELPAMLGLVLAFTTEDFRHLLYLGAASLVLMLLNRPPQV